MCLPRALRPCETVESIFDVDYERLRQDGKRTILFDLDKTLRVRWAKDLFPGAERLLEDLREAGFSIGIVTNRKRIRQDPLLRALSARVEVVRNARKPRRKAFLTLLETLGVQADEAVMIGDRRVTDVLGANRAGIYSILVANLEAARRSNR